MSENKMSITRALNEIKLIEKRIEKKINAFIPCGVVKGDTPVTGYTSNKAFIDDKKGDYQSINDLISRRSEIKRKVVLSNAKTTVKIGDVEVTVAEAIDMKNSWVMSIIKLRDRISIVSNQCHDIYERNSAACQLAVDRQLEALYGRDNKKVTEDEIKAVQEPYIKNNGPNLVSVIDCNKTIEKLTEKVTEFTLNVDQVLAESNATTFITLD